MYDGVSPPPGVWIIWRVCVCPTHWNFKWTFLEKMKCVKFDVYFPLPSHPLIYFPETVKTSILESHNGPKFFLKKIYRPQAKSIVEFQKLLWIISRSPSYSFNMISEGMPPVTTAETRFHHYFFYF